MKNYHLVIIGAGPAGLAAACSAYDAGEKDILVIERDEVLGGILNQCIHNGFGLHHFKEELTGPEYAGRYIEMLEERGIDYMLNTFVLSVSPEREITCMSQKDGLFTLHPDAIILAMGCRERSRGALQTPGTRPAGVFTAGTAQRLTNIEGFLPGRRVVILGSGDIGLIMARRMTLEGAKVLCVAEIMPFSAGLKRNIVQCLNDYDIPLYFNTTISRIVGKERVEGVWLSEVDEHLKPIPGTERFYECDTVLLSVGLIPENELSLKAGVELDPRTKGAVVTDHLMTSVPGIFACGNVLHVNDLVDNVSEEAERAGRNAARYTLARTAGQEGAASLSDADAPRVPVVAGEGISYTMPQFVDAAGMEEQLVVHFRVRALYRNQALSVYVNGERIRHQKKKALAPGEMGKVILLKKDLEHLDLKEIELRVEA